MSLDDDALWAETREAAEQQGHLLPVFLESSQPYARCTRAGCGLVARRGGAIAKPECPGWVPWETPAPNFGPLMR